VLRAIARCRHRRLGGHLDECVTVVPSGHALTTAAVTGTARSVKPTPATVARSTPPGTSADAPRSMLSSPYLMTGAARLAEQKTPVPSLLADQCRNPPRSRSRSQTSSALRSASSVCSTPGIQKLDITRTCTVSCRRRPSLARTHWIPHARASFFRQVSAASFRVRFVAALKRNFRQGKLGFHSTLKPSLTPKPSPPASTGSRR